jgi:hypothetical protein
VSVNPLRGEAALLLGSTEYKFRPTFAALCAVEAEIGSIFRLVERAADGDLSLADLAALLWHCVDDARPLERAEFSQALIEGGLVRAAPVARQMLRQALEGL